MMIGVLRRDESSLVFSEGPNQQEPLSTESSITESSGTESYKFVPPLSQEKCEWFRERNQQEIDYQKRQEFFQKNSHLQITY